jgi:hypothetical protein
MAVTLPVVIGAVLGRLYDNRAERARNPETMKRMGVLMATGLIVGESLFGVAFAGIVGATDNDSPLAVVEEFAWAVPLGLVVFAGSIAWLYMRTRREADQKLANEPDTDEPPQAAVR